MEISINFKMCKLPFQEERFQIQNVKDKKVDFNITEQDMYLNLQKQSWEESSFRSSLARGYKTRPVTKTASTRVQLTLQPLQLNMHLPLVNDRLLYPLLDVQHLKAVHTDFLSMLAITDLSSSANLASSISLAISEHTPRTLPITLSSFCCLSSSTPKSGWPDLLSEDAIEN